MNNSACGRKTTLQSCGAIWDSLCDNYVIDNNNNIIIINPFSADPVKALHSAMLVWPTFLILDTRALWTKMAGQTSMTLNPPNSSNLEQLALTGLIF